MTRQLAASRRCLTVVVTVTMSLWSASLRAADPWITFDGTEGIGHGKQVVLISGDEEYRSEEGLPQLAKILATRQGFHCTVLFSINPKDGTIDPNEHANTPGTEALRTADLMVILTRFRNPTDEQMKEIADYVDSGRPIVGLRTATHAFDIPGDRKYARFSWHFDKDKDWRDGFGRRILGETWINHHGHHGSQSTRGLIAPGMADQPILRGIKDGDVWGPTDVYEVRLPLQPECKPLILGQVLTGMKPTDPPVEGKQNDPMMPVAWIKTYTSGTGKTGRSFTTTMGAATDLKTEGTRRLIVNACLWAVRLEEKIPEKTNVDLVGPYDPHNFGFGGFQKGLKPEDYAK